MTPTVLLSPPELDAIKTRQQATWASGDYSIIGSTLQIVAEELCESAELRPGQRVLDVAAGHGNASLAAARRWCEVVSTDYVPQLLERGRERAAAERFPIELRVADAEALPFPDGSFDAVLSVFGVMFAPNPAKAASELARVCRPGGKIALASWTPEGFIGELFRIVGRHVPPPPGVESPALWGTRKRLQELLGSASADLRTSPREFVFRYRSASHWLEVFRRFYGPVHRAFAALDAKGQAALESDVTDLLKSFDRSDDATLAVPSEYLEAVVVRRR